MLPQSPPSRARTKPSYRRSLRRQASLCPRQLTGFRRDFRRGFNRPAILFAHREAGIILPVRDSGLFL